MRFSLLSVFAAVFMFTASAHAGIESDGFHIRVDKGTANPMPIAVMDLSSPDGSSSSLGSKIMEVVAADLDRSGLFRPIDKSAFIERSISATAVPRFAEWKQINAQAVVSGTITSSGNGKSRVAFRLWDVYGQKQAAGKEFNSLESNWRRIAHLMADEIYKNITGEDGYFDSRIVYVAESGPLKKRVKRLAIMDQDSENHKYLTDGRNLVLTPRFSPNSQEILYMSYANHGARVYLRDLQSGQEESLGKFDGMSFAPRFSNDGSKAIMSIAKGGSTQIFAMDLRSRTLHQLTNTPGVINTSPSYSPDGSKIVFNSDRGGSQQLYVMDANGGNVQRISFGSGAYGTPVWSPRGDKIAFTKPSTHGNFSIGVMEIDGNSERELSNSTLEEGPTWSPNGRVIMFYRQASSSRNGSGGRSRLYSVDLTGSNLREVMTPTDASDPAWSPRLPM